MSNTRKLTRSVLKTQLGHLPHRSKTAMLSPMQHAWQMCKETKLAKQRIARASTGKVLTEAVQDMLVGEQA